MTEETREKDRMEQVAEALHHGWMQWHLDRGWTAGSERDDEKQTHPHLIPWSDLRDADRNQDRFQAAMILAERAGDFSKPVEPSEIHEAWVRWITIHGGTKPHAQAYADVHAHDGGREHAVQALTVTKLFETWRAH